MRARICAGMKRYFHTKSIEGLLSNRVRNSTVFSGCSVQFRSMESLRSVVGLDKTSDCLDCTL